MNQKMEFRVGDTVQVGNSAEKGKITDIVNPLGTFSLYKVHLFTDGRIVTVGRHELVKGLPIDCFHFGTGRQVSYIPASDVFEDSVIDTIDEQELESFLKDIQEKKVNGATSGRFAEPIEIDTFIAANENDKTRQKTLCHQKLLETYLAANGEKRPIHQVPVTSLNDYLCQFIVSVRQKNGKEYEPVTLWSMISSFERYLKKHNYGTSLVTGYEFSKMREVLKCKQKDLKKTRFGQQTKGGRRNYR